MLPLFPHWLPTLQNRRNKKYSRCFGDMISAASNRSRNMVRLDHLCLALILWHLPDVNMQDCPNNFGPETDSRIQRVPGKRGEPGTVDYVQVGEMIQEAQDPALAKIRDDISTMSGRVDRLSDKQEIRELEKEVEDLENKLMTEIKTKINEMSEIFKAETSASSKVSGAADEIKKVPQVVDDFIEKKILELSNKFEIDMKSKLRKSSRKLEASCEKKMEKMEEKFDTDLAKLNEKLDRLQLTTPSTTARKPDTEPPTTPMPMKSRGRNRKPIPTQKPVKTTTYEKPRPEGSTAVRNGPFRIFSKNFPTHTIGLDLDGYPSIVSSEKFRFQILSPGLTGEPGTVSLASADFPDHYLRHKKSLIYLNAFEEKSVYFADATFHLREHKFYHGYFVLESTNLPGHYIRHQEHRLKLSQEDHTELLHLDASFKAI